MPTTADDVGVGSVSTAQIAEEGAAVVNIGADGSGGTLKAAWGAKLTYRAPKRAYDSSSSPIPRRAEPSLGMESEKQ